MIFGYGVACLSWLVTVILFISMPMQVLRHRMGAEVAARSQLSAATDRIRVEDEAATAR